MSKACEANEDVNFTKEEGMLNVVKKKKIVFSYKC